MSIAEYRANWYDEDYESALKFVQENGLLIDKYIIPFQAVAITPEMFVNFAFGENVENKDELVAYIKENISKQEFTPTPTGLEDEEEDNEEDE